VDATNLYVDYRLGNKVYVKLLNQYTDINYGSLRIGVFMLTPIMKEQWADCLKTTKKVLNASCTNVKEELLVRAISLGDLVKDSNLNTLVELSDVQFTEAV
jgi:hypothetical protein